MADAGIFVPEFAIHTLLGTLATALNAGTYAAAAPEAFVSGAVPAAQLTDFYAHCAAQKVKVGFTLPGDQSGLPWIGIIPESWAPAQAFLGDVLSEDGDRITVVAAEIAVASATGGETTVTLDHDDAVDGSVVVRVAGVTLATDAYSVNLATGVITLDVALTAGQQVSVDYHYFSPGVTVFGEVSDHRFRIFVLSVNPEVTILLAALVWRTLLLGRGTLETSGGLVNIRVSSEALSPWNDVLPDFAFSRQFVVNGVASHSASVETSYVRSLLAQLDDAANTRVGSFTLRRKASA